MKLHVAVLFGGKSTEHEISVISAVQAMEHMDPEKYEIHPVYITKSNVLYTGAVLRNIQRYRDIPSLIKDAVPVVFRTDGTRTWLEKTRKGGIGKRILAPIDVAFPIVHGTNVEDGSLQGFLKMLNLPFVGCDVLSSAVGMDKYVMKQFLAKEGFPVLPAVRLTAADYADAVRTAERAESAIGYPMIVKPVNLGSSIGISKASDRDGLLNALDTAFSFSDEVLVEHAVLSLREINCSVLGDRDGAEASVLEEPFGRDEILSYKDKYLEGGSGSGTKTGPAKTVSEGMASLKRRIPAEIPEETAAYIRDLAVRAFLAMNCSGITRIDFMIDKEDDSVYINEINTIPGSLAFYLWEPSGVSYKELLDRLISLALKRARKQAGLTYSFDTNIFALGGGMGGSKAGK